jgi:hypothetical protein
MTDANSFTNASIDSAGTVGGADEAEHDLFKIEKGDGPPLYGDYFYIFPNDEPFFNIEIGVFGYLDPYAVGDLDPTYRLHFTAEESEAVEQLIRSFFLSNPRIFTKRWPPPLRFSGGVSFRPNWIIRKDLDRM